MEKKEGKKGGPKDGSYVNKSEKKKLSTNRTAKVLQRNLEKAIMISPECLIFDQRAFLPTFVTDCETMSSRLMH